MQLTGAEWENLLDILAGRYQAAAKGYRARIEIDYVIPGFSEVGEPQDLNLAYGTVTRDAARHTGDVGAYWGETGGLPAYANDGNDVTNASVSNGLFAFADYLKADLGAAYECTAFNLLSTTGPNLLTVFQYSLDGSSWVDLDYTETGGRSAPGGATLTFAAPVTARYWAIGATAAGNHSAVELERWSIIGTAVDVVADTIGTASYQPTRIGIDKSRRMTAAQLDVELENELGGIGVSPDSAVKTNAPIRAYEWYGVPANEVLVFTGLIDVIHESRDVRTVKFTARDMMKRLIEQTFSTTAPQGEDEDGAVRTAANGVYIDYEVDAIVSDLLDRAGWPAAARDITPTSYLLDEYVLNDGASWADCIIGDDKLTGLTGYEAFATEAGVFVFRPMLASVAADTDTAAVPVYSYVVAADGSDNLISRNVIRLDHEIDDYELRTRVKVRGSLTTLKDAWTELWRTNVIRRPTGVWYDPADSGNIRVADGNTHKVYKVSQTTRAIVSATAALTTKFLNGLSGDPGDATVYWLLEAPWVVGESGNSKIHKVTKATNTVAATFDIGTAQWTDIKADATHLWLTNFTDDRIHKRSKTDGSAVADYATTYANPTGIAIDGADYYIGFFGRNVFLKYAVGAFTTILRTLRFSGTRSLGGDLDTDTHTEGYFVAPELGLVYKMTLASPVDEAVAVEVVDSDLEDELGFLAGAEDREHDTHPGDADHPFEIRRETITLRKTITNVAQATETAQRALAELAHRREVLDLGVVGHPGLQLGDLLQITDPVTGIDAEYVLDTYRDNMDERGYLGIVALVPYEPTY